MPPHPHPHTDAEPCPGGCDDMDDVTQRLARGDKRMNAIEGSLETLQDDVSEVLEILRMGRAFFKAAGYFGAFIKWAVPIGVSLASFYYMLKNGGKS